MPISYGFSNQYLNTANLYSINKAITESTNRISTGKQINSASDNVALIHSVAQLKTEAAQALLYARNATQGVSALTKADGVLDEMTDMVNRFRELAVLATNTATTDSERTAYSEEAGNLVDLITQLSTDTKHNNTALLDGTYTSKTFQVGASTTSKVTVSLNSASAASLGAYILEGSTRDALAASTSATANTTTANEDITIATTSIDVAVNESAKAVASKINTVTTTTGVTATAETYALLASSDGSSTTYTIKVNDTATASFSISSTDVSGAVTAINAISTTTGVTATATSAFKVLLHDADGDDITIENTDSDTGLSVQAVQRDGSTTQGSAVSLQASDSNDATRVIGTIRLSSDETFSVTQSGTASLGYLSTASSTLQALSSASLSNSINAAKALTIADAALDQISTMRGSIGAASSHLEFSAFANRQQEADTTNALAFIEDADIAVEAAKLAKAQMLQKASLAIQAQAQNADELIIALLKGAA